MAAAAFFAHGRLVEEEGEEDEDYIDMDMSSGDAFLCCSIPPPPPPRSGEFEFQMGARPAPAASSADELFYEGKLLPLHPPPRLQMVEKLLEHSDGPPARCSTGGPSDESGKCSAVLVRSRRRSSWSTKLDSKLKASGAYLKSLFSRRRAEPCAVEKAAGKQAEEDAAVLHRKSLSGAMNWSLAAVSSSSSASSSSSSSSSSFSAASSNRFGHPPVLLSRSSSFNSEAECSIQGAIAHCKMSQQARIPGRKSASDVGICSLSSSVIASACGHHHHQLSYKWL